MPEIDLSLFNVLAFINELVFRVGLYCFTHSVSLCPPCDLGHTYFRVDKTKVKAESHYGASKASASWSAGSQGHEISLLAEHINGLS